MKKQKRRRLSLLLALALALALALPAQAAMEAYVPESQTFYLMPDEPGIGEISVSYLPKSQKISKASVKSSNKKAVTVKSLNHSSDIHSSATEYYEKGLGDSSYASETYSAKVLLNLKKAGTSVVSFKIGSKTYKSKVVVKKYANPVKSLTITGVNGGKNLASSFKNSNSAIGKLKTTTKDTWIKVKAASGWRITGMSFNYVYKYLPTNMSQTASSATLYVGKVRKGQYCVLSVEFVNLKTQGTVTINYDINININ